MAAVWAMHTKATVSTVGSSGVSRTTRRGDPEAGEPAVDRADDGDAVMRGQAEGVNGDDGQDQPEQRPRKALVDRLRHDDHGEHPDGDADRPAG